MTRQPKKRIKIFVEGKSEKTYFEGISQNYLLDIFVETIDMQGGGYTNFLNHVKRTSSVGYLAFFIIIDLDRYKNISGEPRCFKRLIDYCKRENVKQSSAPHFILASAENFEYFVATHYCDYSDEEANEVITQKLGYKTLDDFKGCRDIYNKLNKEPFSLVSAIKKTKTQSTFLKHTYTIKEREIDYIIKCKNIIIDDTFLSQNNSNVFEFFDVLKISV